MSDALYPKFPRKDSTTVNELKHHDFSYNDLMQNPDFPQIVKHTHKLSDDHWWDLQKLFAID